MSTVLGVDFGTHDVRVTVFDDSKGRRGAGVASYPLHRVKHEPLFATQSHDDHLRALVQATQSAMQNAGVDGESIEAIAIDTTGSSVVFVDKHLRPLDDYYMWCDHRAWREADEITALAREAHLESIAWCGGTYSAEWGFSKLLHWLRNNSEKRDKFATALEHCDMIAAVLCNITRLDELPRSICAMGHKWMWNDSLGGLPPDSFWVSLDPVLRGVRAKIACGHYRTAGSPAGTLCENWANLLGLSQGIPVAMGALDAHWDAIGAGIQLGDAVNVVGTSTCIIGMSEASKTIPGVCGVVPGSVHPSYVGIEAGLSATGDIFDAIARRASKNVEELSSLIGKYRAGQTGLLRLTWDNGDRTILANHELSGVTLGWNLMHGPEDELFASIEGTAFHTRIILEHMEAHGAQITRVINGGGIPRKSPILNQIYANVLNKPVLVPKDDITGLGAGIFAFVAAGIFTTVEQAQKAHCPSHQVFEPEGYAWPIYEELFEYFRLLYFGLGMRNQSPADLSRILPNIRRLASSVRSSG